MTEPLTPSERDELASAYLDGELNQDGIALIEGDPGLLDLVAEHRDVQSKVASPTTVPSAVLRATHLASALAAFDELGTSVPIVDLTDLSDQTEDDTVISLSERSSVRESRRTRSGMPTWLSAAAASVAVLGGLTYATTQFNGGSDDSDGASAALDSGEDAASATTFAAAEADLADSDDAMQEDVFSDPSAAMSEGPAESSEGIETTEAQAPDDDGEGADEEIDRVATSHEPEIEFPADFTASDIVQVIGNAGFPIEESVCGFSYEPPPELAKAGTFPEPDRFLPVLVGEEVRELFVYGPETAVLVDIITCETVPE